MNKSELCAQLKNEKVPQNCYSLEGGLPDDCFVLNKKGETWEVYYTERGKIYEQKSFPDEDSACNYMYDRVKKMLEVY